MKKKHFCAAVILLLLLAIGIQPVLAIDIPTDTSVGTWDGINRIYTLTTDVTEGIDIIEDNLTLDGLDPDGVTIHTVTPIWWDEGVDLYKRSGVTIRNLNVTGGTAGISLRLSDGCTVTDNTVSACDYGIWLAGSSNNTVTGNTANGNDNAGIWLTEMMKGAEWVGSDDNTLTGNTIKEHNIGSFTCGMHIQDSSENTIYNNNFINNSVQANVIGASTGNSFNENEPTGGNYWNDYMGVDTNCDGIGDTELPYNFNGGKDDLPWVQENGWSNPVVDTTPPDISCPGDLTIEVQGPDGVPVEDEQIQTFLDGASATDNCDASPVIHDNAPAVFPPGDTVVTFIATDVSGNSSSCSSTVTVVESPADAVEYIRDYIEQMDVPEDAEKEMGKAVTELNKAIDEFNNDRIDKAFNNIAKAVKQLMKAQKEDADTQDVIDELVDLVQGIAEKAIEDAIGSVGPENLHVVKAQEHYDKALGNLADGKYDAAIKNLKNAYREAMKALGE